MTFLWWCILFGAGITIGRNWPAIDTWLSAKIAAYRAKKAGEVKK